MRNVSRFVGAALVLALAVAGCRGRRGGEGKTITIKGSDTMVILGQRWAEAYMKSRPDVVVQVTGGGSGTGIAALINGGTDICESSRPMTAREREQVKARRGGEVVETPVALDGVTVYVNEASSLRSISIPKLKAIYTGKITNWKGLGGPDAKIVLYSRENNSGTYAFFKEHVLGGDDFAADAQTLPGTAAVINAVLKDKRSIGYGGVAYAEGVRELAVREDEAHEAVLPSPETVADGTYPLSRELYFYTVGEPTGELKAFVDWTLSDEGQRICEEVGYYPLKRK